MKLSHLILQREALLRQTRLSNLAFAYGQLDQLVTRIDRARLYGPVCLEPANPAIERYWPVLTVLEGSQSVIEEHFTEEHVSDLADLIAFLTGREGEETSFRLEDLAAIFLAPLRDKLLQEGIELELPRTAEPGEGGPGRK